MVIEDAETYSLNFEEASTPTEAGGTHIGHFLGWAIVRGLASAEMTARPLLALMPTRSVPRSSIRRCSAHRASQCSGQRVPISSTALAWR
ncbi:DUF7832 domain-containing protein [Gemmatimonas sp.]